LLDVKDSVAEILPIGGSIMAKRRTSYDHNIGGRSSRRKTYRKKSTAKRAARGRSVYKVRGGYRLACKKHSRRRHRR
jgi:hypothetical protein